MQSILKHHHEMHPLLPGPQMLPRTRPSPLPTLLTYTMPAYPPIPTVIATTNIARVPKLPECQTPAYVLLCHLISQLILCEGTGVAHVLHNLYRAIRKRRSQAWQVAGFTEEDLWLILDEVLAHRQALNEVIIVLDVDGQRGDSLGVDDGMRGIRWVVERLVGRAIEGGPERNGLIKMVIATTTGPGDRMLFKPETPNEQEDNGGLYKTIDLDSLETKVELVKVKVASFGLQQLTDVSTAELGTPSTQSQVVALLITQHASLLDLQLASALPVAVPADGLDPLVYSTDPIAYRNVLYSKHYAYLFATTLTTPMQRLWVYETLGWLLYNAGSTRCFKGISIAEVALAVSLSLIPGRPSPCSQLTGALHFLPSTFVEVQGLITGVLGRTPFVKITTFPSPSTETDGGNGNQKKIDLAHSSVREFLLQGDATSISFPTDLGVAPPGLADAAAWHTRLALTCVKFLEMDVKAVVNVKFAGAEMHMDQVASDVRKYEEELSELSVVGELGIDEQTEEAVEAEEVEGVQEDEEGGNPKHVGSGVDKGCTEDSPSLHGENQGPPTIPSLLLLRYSILNWPFHVYHSTNHQDPPFPRLYKVIKTFLTTNDRLLRFWHKAYSFLARCPTNITLLFPDILLNSPLNLACYFGFLPLVRQLVPAATRGGRLSLPDRLLALEAAAGNGWADICGYLLHIRGGKTLSIRDFFTPLLFAVRNGHLAATKVFLFGGQEEGNMQQRQQRGKERCYIILKCEKKHWGYSELIKQAAKNGHADVLKALLDAIHTSTGAETDIHSEGTGANLSVPQSEPTPSPVALGGARSASTTKATPATTPTTVPSSSLPRLIGTPLHHAAKSGFATIARVLLDPRLPNFCTNPNQIDRKKFTPLHYAASKGHLSILQLLLAQPQVDVDTRGWAIKPLHLAAGEGYPVIVEELLGSNAMAEVFDSDGQSPLHYACLEGHVDVVHQLLRRADIDASHAENTNGITPLHLATNFGSLEIVDALISSGAEPNAVTADTGSTPLHYAATKGWHHVARRLLVCGAACDPKLNENMFTPLHLSVYYECSGPPARNSDSREARATRESPGPPASPHDSWVARSTRETAE